jgi:Ethanolamine utilization protein EutJ (predicted chaperonin)
MFIPAANQDVFRPVGRAFLPGDVIANETSGGQHAKLLQTAAARRLRSAERVGCGRNEDAEYWKQCAPVALRKASALRLQSDFRRLP